MKIFDLELGKWDDMSRYSDLWYPIDFRKPEQFCRFGIAREYYVRSFDYILSTYPYDGSWKQKKEWFDSLMPWDRYLYKNVLPKTTGYIKFSANGWGNRVSNIGGVGEPQDKEYIKFLGGPSRYGEQKEKANLYQPQKYRGGNLSFGKENTVEFFLRRGNVNSFITTEKSCVLDVWNREPYGSNKYRRMLIYIEDTNISGIKFVVSFAFGTNIYTRHFYPQENYNFYLIDDKWHFYTFTFRFVEGNFIIPPRLYVDFYVDGEKFDSSFLDISFFDYVNMGLVGTIGAFQAQFSASTAGIVEGSGKLECDLDEFRFYHYCKTPDDIKIFSKTSVFGGTDNDEENLGLGIYYKFNEGVVGVLDADKKILDYSGRKTNGYFHGYTPASRVIGSAFEEKYQDIVEDADLILYKSHPDVDSVYRLYEKIGEEYDLNNNNSVFMLLPQFFREEYDSEELRGVCQIVGSFFDLLILYVYNLHVEMHDSLSLDGRIPIEANRKYLESLGIKLSDLFGLANWRELMLGIEEEKSITESIEKIKRIILSNIANNAMFILKSKGTLNSFFNAVRCFGGAEDVLTVKRYFSSGIVDTESEVTYPKYYRDRVLKLEESESYTRTTVCAAKTSNAKDSFVIGPVADSIIGEINHTFLCSFYTSKIIPSITTGSLFGCNGLNGGTRVFGVFADVVGNGGGVEFYIKSDVFGVDTSSNPVYVRNFFDGSRYVAVLEIASDSIEFLYNGVEVDDYNMSLKVYRVVDFELEKVVDVIVPLVTSEVANMYSLQEYSFYCGAERLTGVNGELDGNLRNYSFFKISNFRYMLNKIREDDIKRICFDYNNSSISIPFSQKFKTRYCNYFNNVFNWELSYVDKEKSFYDSSVNNSLYMSDTTGFFSSVAKHFPYKFVGEGSQNMDLLQDVYYNGEIRKTREDDLMSFDIVHFNNIESGKYLKKNKFGLSKITIEKNLSDLLDREIFLWFLNTLDYFSLFNIHSERYSYSYNVLEYAKRVFFINVKNKSIDFNKYFYFYKWIDDAVSEFLWSVIPDKNVHKNHVNVVGQHVLERSKIFQKRILSINSVYPVLFSSYGTLSGFYANSFDIGIINYGISCVDINRYYMYSYEYLNTNGQYQQNRFFVINPGYEKYYYKMHPLKPRVFYDNYFSPLNYEYCYNNFVDFPQRKRGKNIFSNVFNDSLEQNGKRRIGDVGSLEYTGSSNCNYRNIEYRKRLNWLASGYTI